MSYSSVRNAYKMGFFLCKIECEGLCRPAGGCVVWWTRTMNGGKGCYVSRPRGCGRA